MAADISRVRFDALRRFAGVTLQQGRVLLDADFNEYVAMIDRRLRAETVDLTSFGPDPDRRGSSWVPRHTPDGFRVTAQAGDLLIGRGRMYVDGLLAENPGRALADLAEGEAEELGVEADGFDPLLDDVIGLTDVRYSTQPFWPDPDPLPDGGPHLVYLDVWDRELTHIEDPDLVEVALGVDSTARRQTAWQVRVLEDVGSGACSADDDDLPAAWLEEIAPSGARLTITTAPVDEEDDPCALPPTGGYRGLENQTYRIEIHEEANEEAGAPATFKWSRDNASVATTVTEMVSPTVLRLASVGRDDVLRISTGDWVEVLDDGRELDRRPGEMRQVTVDDAARTITFDDALPADLQPADADDAAARHLRVRRWDQRGAITTAAGATLGNVDTNGGVIDVPAAATTQVVLEHGIVASFTLADGGRYRTGDHWIVAARTADTSVEELVQAPPLGPHHHYARLATVTFDDAQTDCRRLWPPVDTGGGGDCGDCTVCVTTASHESGELTVQMAVDVVRETGGTVCLSAGVFDVGDGVVLDGARSVRIHGQGLATIVGAGGTAFSASGAIDLTLERMAIVGGLQSSAAVRLRNVVRGRLRETVVLSFGSEDVVGAAVQLDGVQVWTTLRDNLLVGERAVRGGDGEAGVLSAGLDIVDNVVGGGEVGIDLGESSIHVASTRVTDNDVLAGEDGGIRVTGAAWPGGTVAVRDNVVFTSGSAIVVGGPGNVSGNVVTGVGDPSGEGIVVVSGPFDTGPGAVTIVGNRVEDRAGDGISVRTPVRSADIHDNVLRRVGAGITVSHRGRAVHLRVSRNTVREVVGIRSEVDDELGLAGSAWGIAVARADVVSIVENAVHEVGLELVQGGARVGVFVAGSGEVRVSGNTVDRIGPPEEFIGWAAGIAVLGPFEAATVHDNTARFHGDAQPPVQSGQWVAVVVGRGAAELRGGPRFGAAGRDVVRVDGGSVVLTDGWLTLAADGREAVTVSDNMLTGGGRLPGLLVRAGGDAVVDANQCEQFEGAFVGMHLEASSVTASTNRVRGPEATIVLGVSEERFAAVGNLAPGGTHLGAPGNGLPMPWEPLNPLVN